MDNPNCSTEHRKGQHLTSEERHDIEMRLKDGWSRYKIAKHLIVKSRKEFGHWEFDSVLGSKNADEPVALTMVERMTRVAIWLRVEDHSAAAVTHAIQKLKQEFGTRISDVFKTITADNGSEFAELSAQEIAGIQVYFTHPFS